MQCYTVDSDSIALISSGETLRKRISYCPVQHIAQSKCEKLPIDANIHWRFTKHYISQKDHGNCKNILNYRYKNVSFAWSMDGMWPKQGLPTQKREWRNPVSGLWEMYVLYSIWQPMPYSRNCPGFDPSILRRSGILGAADEAVLNIVHKKKNPKKGENTRIPMWTPVFYPPPPPPPSFYTIQAPTHFRKVNRAGIATFLSYLLFRNLSLCATF